LWDKTENSCKARRHFEIDKFMVIEGTHFEIVNSKSNYKEYAKRVFDSVAAVVFQIIFRAEMHVNDVFLFFKNYF